MGKHKKPVKKIARTSSGKRHQAQARALICRVKMKIKRWERYLAEEKSVSKESFRRAKTDKPSRSRLTWDTSGLKKQLAHYEKMLKKPACV